MDLRTTHTCLIITLLLLLPLGLLGGGCDSKSYNDPPLRFTVNDLPPEQQQAVQVASLEEEADSADTPPETGKVVARLAQGGIQTDARTTLTVLDGPPAKPDPQQFGSIGNQILVAMDEGKQPDEIEELFPPVESPAMPLGNLEDEFFGEGNPSELAPLPEPPRSIEFEGSPTDEGDYLFAPGDTLDVTVWEMPPLSRALVVRPDGYVSYPLIKEIKAEGMTPSQLEDELERRLGEHIVDPVVNVVVTQTSSRAFYVLGAVTTPGAYQWYRRVTLLQSIATANGFSNYWRLGQIARNGDLSRIRIVRTHTDGRREVITKNLSGFDDETILREDMPIQPDDIIYVPEEERLVYVFGEVASPGVVPIGNHSRVLEALLYTGGMIPTAKDNQVLLIRPNDYKFPIFWLLNMKAIECGNPLHNMEVQNGDIIFVPQKTIAKIGEFVQLYTGAIRPALETYLTGWDAWYVHERYSALRRNDFGIFRNIDGTQPVPNPDR